MLRAVSDNPDPQIAVLMTGDGAGYDDRIGLHADLERMYEAGWGVKVTSWRTHCKRGLKDWATQYGVFIATDEYYHQVTFLEGGRFSNPLNLSNRVSAKSRLSPARAAEERERLKAELQMQLRELQEAAALKAARKAQSEKEFARGRR